MARHADDNAPISESVVHHYGTSALLSRLSDLAVARRPQRLRRQFAYAQTKEAPALAVRLMDRFVRGDAVPDDQIREIWRQESGDARFPAELIQREVLAKGRRALAVYGSGHLPRRNIGRNYAPENTIVSVLEGGPSPISVLSVWASELCADPEYMKMRLGRLALFGMTDRIDGLKRYCAEP